MFKCNGLWPHITYEERVRRRVLKQSMLSYNYFKIVYELYFDALDTFGYVCTISGTCMCTAAFSFRNEAFEQWFVFRRMVQIFLRLAKLHNYYVYLIRFKRPVIGQYGSV